MGKSEEQSEFLKEKQINVAVTAEMAATLAEIKAHHHYLAPQVARGLLEGACQFYDRNKWFGFPVRFEVDTSQMPAQIVVKVPARTYQQSDRADPALNEPPDVSDAIAAEEQRKRAARGGGATRRGSARGRDPKT